jgi:SAM-dependent methyltransferase
VTSNSELDRIRRVYSHYDRDPGEQKKRALQNLGNAAIRREFLAAADRLILSVGAIQNSWILDAGCGAGGFLAHLAEIGAAPDHLVGVDLLEDRVRAARLAVPKAKFECGDLRDVRFTSGTFDIICVITLFGSVLDRTIAKQIAGRLTDLLKPNGAVLWCDGRYRNPFNRFVRGWSRAQISELFPGFGVALEPITVVPAIVRSLGHLGPGAYPLLSSVRPLRVRYIGLLRHDGA